MIILFKYCADVENCEIQRLWFYNNNNNNVCGLVMNYQSKIKEEFFFSRKKILRKNN